MRIQSKALDLSIDSSLDEAVHVATERLVREKFASRLFERDLTLWQPGHQAEAAIRLDWLAAPSAALAVIERGEELRSRLVAEGVSRFVLCGMGGSSLGPDMLAKYSGVELSILDSTDPVLVRAALRDLERTAIIVSSKSGTTVESRSQLAAFEAAFTEAGISPASRTVVITDPESDLARFATSHQYELVLADPNVGGRFSVLTAYGLIPATIAGADLRSVIRDAQSVHSLLSNDAATNPALALAAAAVELKAGLLFSAASNSFGFGDWVEQLVAESTGKAGVGILPVVLPQTRKAISESIPLQLVGNLGQLIFTWEVATAAMGWLLGVNPFDQPDVERSKQAARAILDAGDDAIGGENTAVPFLRKGHEIVDFLSKNIRQDGYLAIQIFGGADENLAHELQAWASDRLRVPVTLGWGPRFLHSTGQLHKGGAKCGTFLQIEVERDHTEDLAIPNQQFTFAQLLHAQALGDASILSHTGQPVIQTSCSIEELLEAFSSQF